jgi:hypothetical protein
MEAPMMRTTLVLPALLLVGCRADHDGGDAASGTFRMSIATAATG